jgi:hypothetical protein
MNYKYELHPVAATDLSEQPVLKLEAGWEIIFVVPSRIKNNDVIEYKILYRRSDKDGKRKDFDN